MPWTEFKLNDGNKIPGVGFGSSGHPLEKTADDINLAIECGFDHIDTAQSRSLHLFHMTYPDTVYAGFRVMRADKQFTRMKNK
jgi:hypothetical protein